MTSLMMVIMYLLQMHILHLHFYLFIAIALISFYCIRQQILITEQQFLKGMIPYHAMAVHISKSISNKTHDPRIKKSAQNIIKIQRNEINLMKSY